MSELPIIKPNLDGLGNIRIAIQLFSVNKQKIQLSNNPKDTVDYLQNDIRFEDRQVEKIELFREDGSRVSYRTQLSSLYCNPFLIKIFQTDGGQPAEYNVCAIKTFENVNAPNDHKVKLLQKVYNLETEIEPFRMARNEIEEKSYKRTRIIAWGVLAAQALQFGFLARLTWWEYSWDIMEPVTYFVTYGTGMLMLAYYLATKQEYIYPDVFNRQKSIISHKMASSDNFDNAKYHQLYHELEQSKNLLKKIDHVSKEESVLESTKNQILKIKE